MAAFWAEEVTRVVCVATSLVSVVTSSRSVAADLWRSEPKERTAVRSEPQITLEELDGDEVVVRITAIPQDEADGPTLASDVLAAVASQTRSADTPDDEDR